LLAVVVILLINRILIFVVVLVIIVLFRIVVILFAHRIILARLIRSQKQLELHVFLELALMLTAVHLRRVALITLAQLL
jgi:hypothetical protein